MYDMSFSQEKPVNQSKSAQHIIMYIHVLVRVYCPWYTVGIIDAVRLNRSFRPTVDDIIMDRAMQRAAYKFALRKFFDRVVRSHARCDSHDSM